MISQAGFSLLEVLAALAIAAMVAGVGLPAVWQSTERLQDASVRMAALCLASSKLQEFTAISLRKNVPREGSVNGLRWRVAIGADDKPGEAGLGAALYLQEVRVVVAASDENEPLVSLAAVRLKPRVE